MLELKTEGSSSYIFMLHVLSAVHEMVCTFPVPNDQDKGYACDTRIIHRGKEYCVNVICSKLERFLCVFSSSSFLVKNAMRLISEKKLNNLFSQKFHVFFHMNLQKSKKYFFKSKTKVSF